MGDAHDIIDKLTSEACEQFDLGLIDKKELLAKCITALGEAFEKEGM